MKRLPVMVLAALGLSLAACGGGGGGGGDEEAFCDSLEALSDQVSDGDLADDDGLEDVTDTVNDLLESAAEGEQLDAVNAVADEIADADADDADATAETVQDELGDFAEDCDIDEDEFAVPVTTEPEETTTTSAVVDDTTTTLVDDTVPPDPGDDTSNINVAARQPIPAGLEPEFATQAEQCFNGDAPVCDDLFRETPVGSIAEAYGETCGGRIPPGTPGICAQVITAPATPPTDIAEQGLASDCFDGDMIACDDLFRGAAEGTSDRTYGALCGFRVQNTDAFCVDIFGEEALF